MGTEHLYEGVKQSGDLVGAAELQYVWLWDTGPVKPKLPDKPIAPKSGKEGDPEYELAMVEFKETLSDYEAARAQYRRELKDHADWWKKFGGPFEMRMFSCDAHDALARGGARYAISSRTRGHERLKNGGLPVGMKPGPAHAENLRRQEAGESDLAEARRKDPVFGQQEMRS